MRVLESEVRTLTSGEIRRFVDVVRESSGGDHLWPPDHRFFFDGTAGLKLSREEETSLRQLWTRMNAGLVYAITGNDVENWIDRPGLLARLDRIGPRWSQIEGRAASILERELGGEVWLGTIGIWNALCAALLGARLSAELRGSLSATWDRVRPGRPIQAG